jgi:quercetin dioxygenase-like cupin family protein
MSFPISADDPTDPVDPRYTTRGAIHVPSGGGVTKWVAGDVYTMKVTAKETNGALGFIEASVPPGGGPPPHSHNSGDEAFFLLSGELEFLNGDRTFVAGAGDFIFVPRGIRHRFKNIGIHTTKMIFMFTPGGLEEVFVQGGEEPRPGEPAPAWGPEKFGPMTALVERLGLHSEVLF